MDNQLSLLDQRANQWLTCHRISQNFNVRDLDLKNRKRIAIDRAKELDEPLNETLAAAGAVAVKHRGPVEDTLCAGCGSYVEDIIACSRGCGRSFCLLPGVVSATEAEPPRDVPCINASYVDLANRLPKNSRTGKPAFICPSCFKHGYPGKQYKLVEFTAPVLGVQRRATMAPLIIIGLSLRELYPSTPLRIVRETFETLYSTHMEVFLYVHFWLLFSEFADFPKKLEKNMEIIQFLEKHLNARILTIIDTHSRSESGALTFDGAGSTAVTPNSELAARLGDITVEAVFKHCFSPECRALIAGSRKGLEFDEYKPDPLRALILCSCGGHMKMPVPFKEAKAFVDQRQFDFVLGFANAAVYTIDFADGLTSFLVDVFLKDVSVWSARENCFSNESRMVGLNPVLIQAAPLTNTMSQSLQKKDNTWAQRWASNTHARLVDVPKNSKYKTQCSVLTLAPGYMSNFGFPIPKCSNCQQNQFVRTQSLKAFQRRTRLYCTKCNFKASYDAPQPGLHFLQGRNPKQLIWPWPMSLAGWNPTIYWSPKNDPEEQSERNQIAPITWSADDLPESDAEDDAFKEKEFEVKTQPPDADLGQKRAKQDDDFESVKPQESSGARSGRRKRTRSRR